MRVWWGLWRPWWRPLMLGIVAGVLLHGPVMASARQFSAPIMEALRTLGWSTSDSVHTVWTKSFQWPGGAYLTVGTTFGSTGYGFRDNAGVMQVKSSGGAWGTIASETAASGATCTAFVNGLCTSASTDDLLLLVRQLEDRVMALEASR